MGNPSTTSSSLRSGTKLPPAFLSSVVTLDFSRALTDAFVFFFLSFFFSTED